MKISKTTLNYATKRNLELTFSIWEDDSGNNQPVVLFWELGEDCEPMFIYNNNEETLSYRGYVYLDQKIKEELPATIFDEKQLRNMIDFLSKELAKK